MLIINKKISVITICCFFISLIALVGFTDYQKDLKKSQDIEEVKKVVIRLSELEQRLPILPDPHNKNVDKIPSDVKTKHKEKIKNELSEVISYSSPLLMQRISLMNNAIDGQEKEKFRAEDGGVKKADFKVIDINGDSAIVTVDVTCWSKLTHYGDTKVTSTPQGTLRMNYTLIKEDNKWKITGLTGDYLPGQQP